MKTLTKKPARQASIAAVAGALFLLLGLLGSVSPAQAAYYDTDYVNTMNNVGDGVSGYVNWTSAYAGNAQLTVRNNLADKSCVLVQDRVERGGVWSGWVERGPYCFNASYPLNLTISNNGRPVQAWQFRTRPAWASNWIYDTNSPGGA
jgi:hypothetical protein